MGLLRPARKSLTSSSRDDSVGVDSLDWKRDILLESTHQQKFFHVLGCSGIIFKSYLVDMSRLSKVCIPCIPHTKIVSPIYCCK